MASGTLRQTVWGGLAGLASMTACGDVSLSERPCPCVADYVCCRSTNVCVPASEPGACPSSDGSPNESDAVASDTGMPTEGDAFEGDGGSTGLDAAAVPDVWVADTALPDAPNDGGGSSDDGEGGGLAPDGSVGGLTPDGSMGGLTPDGSMGGLAPDGSTDAWPCSGQGLGHSGTWYPLAPSPLWSRNGAQMLWTEDLSDPTHDGLPDATGNGAMFVWGGMSPDGRTLYDDGALYNPRTDEWARIESDGGPPAVAGAVAVWTGRKVVVFGTTVNAQTVFYTYDVPATTWSVGAAPPFQYFTGGTNFAAWTGSKMLTFTVGQGASYDPASDSWSTMNTTGAACAQQGTAVWTGSLWILWGGDACMNSEIVVDTGAAYDPSNDTWTPIPVQGAPSARRSHTAVWTGSEMIIWGGTDMTGQILSDGGAYDPATHSWRTITEPPGLAQTVSPTAVGIPGQMLLWSGYSDPSGQLTPQGSQYDACGRAWWRMPTTNQPSLRPNPSSVWTGVEMIVWGGGEPSEIAGTGARYVP